MRQLMQSSCSPMGWRWPDRVRAARLDQSRKLNGFVAVAASSVATFRTRARISLWFSFLTHDFLRGIDEAAITRALNEVEHRMRLGGPRRPTSMAVDATGLSPGAIRTFFVRRLDHHNQQPMPWRHLRKGLVVVDLDRQSVLAQKALAGPTK